MTPRRSADKTALAALLLAAIAVFLTAFLFANQQTQTDKIKMTQDASGLEQIRNCIGRNIQAAVVHERASHPVKPVVITPLIAARLYPIVDCKQSLLKRRTIAISAVEARRYTALVTSGRAPVILNGRVVGSRSSLLQGVRSIEDVGHP